MVQTRVEDKQKASTSKHSKLKKRRYIFGLLIIIIVIVGTVITLNINKQKETAEEEISIEKFFSLEKLAFRESLGVENVDLFPQVNEAQKIVEAIEENADSVELENAKRKVQQILRTPKKLVETFNKIERLDLQAYEDLLEERLKFQRFYEIDFNETLERELHDKSTKQYEEILKAIQEGEATGGESLDKLLGSLGEQGYMLVNYGIEQEPEWLLDNIEFREEIAGDEALLRFLTDNEMIATRAYEDLIELPMEEIAASLLELEMIYDTHNEDKLSPWARQLLSNYAAHLLELYLMTRPDVETTKTELEGFLANHKDSIYWSIIDVAVKEYRSNDWYLTNNRALNKLYIMFDDQFSGVQADDIRSANRWPLDKQTLDHFDLLTEKKDDDFINDLSPKQVVFLYVYIIEEGRVDDTITLYDASIIEDGTDSLRQEMLRQSAAHFWLDLSYETEYVVEKKNKKEATVFFLKNADTPNEISMKFILRKTNEGWKLLDIIAK